MTVPRNTLLIVNNDAEANSHKAESQASNPVDQRPKILCIDDVPEISNILRVRLGFYGVDVVCALSGIQGYQTALDVRPDVIITDWTMPNGGGNHALVRLKSHPLTKEIPVIVLTGQANSDVRRNILKLGAVAYLQKPWAFDELLDKIRNHLILPRLPDRQVGPNDQSQLKVSVQRTDSIDVEELVTLCMGKLEFAQELLADFATDLPRRTGEVSNFMFKADTDRTTKAAHALKGAAGIVGAVAVQRVAADIEAAGESGRLEDMPPLLATLLAQESEFFDVLPDIQNALASVPAT